MDWEYMALKMPERFTSCYDAVVAKGWEEWIRIPWFGEGTVGVYIMRRPKDEPRKEEDVGLAEWHRLYRKFYGVEPPTRFFLPRLDDQPRMWTEKKVERIAKNVLGQSGWTPPRPATTWGDMSGSGKEETSV